MSVLHVVPSTYLRQWRLQGLGERSGLAPVSVQSLAARVLKEGRIPYKEDRILEEIAVWQGVQELGNSLQFFAPIADYPGFFVELQWLFRQLDLGEVVLENIPPQGREELLLLHQAYRDALNGLGILDRPGQLRRALQLVQGHVYLPEAREIKLWGLIELSPLESEFLNVFAGARPIRAVQAAVAEKPRLEFMAAKDPHEEVELIGRAIRAEVEAGVPLERIALVFPQPVQYLPILHAVFARLNLPWRAPATSLRNTPLGKTILILIAGELEGWNKHHLQLLTAPGWGYPFGLSLQELRLLRLAPPLKGLPAWREYLSSEAGWGRVLNFLAGTGENLVERKPVRCYGAWLEEILAGLRPENWVLPEHDLENWAELTKAWAGLYELAGSLQKYDWKCTGNEFLRLFQSLLDNYRIRDPRIFTQQLQVLKVDQLGAYEYDVLFAGGLVEGQFPPRRYTHWLTKKTAAVHREQIYKRLTRSAARIFLYYPEIDREGKLNLPSTLLPGGKRDDGEPIEARPAQLHRPSLYLGTGRVADEKLLKALIARITENGLSVSQLNDYASCPYKFFCSYVLDLEPLEEESLELGPLQRGVILHNVLYKFWLRHITEAGPQAAPLAVPNLEKAQTEVEGLLRQEYGEHSEKPPLAVVSMLRNFMRRDLQLLETGFRPTYLEREFSGLAIKTERGPVKIRGRIDRIDVNQQGDYVLYDYKTGGAPTGPEMIRGEDIQIGAYLLAARDLLPTGRNVGAAYYVLGDSRRAGIFHADYHRRLLIRKGPTCLPQEEFLEQIDFFQRRLAQFLADIFAGEFPIEPVNTRICGYCSFQAICRKEVRSA